MNPAFGPTIEPETTLKSLGL